MPKSRSAILCENIARTFVLPKGKTLTEVILECRKNIGKQKYDLPLFIRIRDDIDEIQTDADRSTTFTIQYGSSTAQIEVNQKGKSNIELSVSPTELPHFSAQGGSQMVRIESNAAWKAYVPSSAKSWMSVEPSEGVGNGEVRVTVTENPSTQRERLSLVIIIAGSQNPKQGDVFVQQYASEEQNNQREPEEGDNPDPTLSRRR